MNAGQYHQVLGAVSETQEFEWATFSEAHVYSCQLSERTEHLKVISKENGGSHPLLKFNKGLVHLSLSLCPLSSPCRAVSAT